MISNKVRLKNIDFSNVINQVCLLEKWSLQLSKYLIYLFYFSIVHLVDNYLFFKECLNK